MQVLEFCAAINPFILAILAAVIACGLYDRWIETHHK
jgi:hypothetical protein